MEFVGEILDAAISETSQILELVGHLVPDVGGTQPHHHRRPRHQHCNLRSIGEKQSQEMVKTNRVSSPQL